METLSNGPYTGYVLISLGEGNFGYFIKLCAGIKIKSVKSDLNISTQRKRDDNDHHNPFREKRY